MAGSNPRPPKGLTKGFGRIPTDALVDTVAKARIVEPFANRIPSALRTLGRTRPSFMAMVTGAEAIGDPDAKRWLYEVQECRMTGWGTTYQYTLVDTPQAIVLSALCDDEADNTADQWGGFPSAQLPTGFKLDRVPDGAVVRVTFERASDGTLFGTFTRSNPIIGTCPPPP